MPKLRHRPVLAVLLLALSACGTPLPSEEEYLRTMAEAARVTLRDTRANAPTGAGAGPLLVDVSSFAAGSRRVIQDRLPDARAEQALRASLAAPFRDTPPDSSFTCMELPHGPSCWVPENGVYLHLNLASRRSDRLVYHVASTVTASHYIPPLLCDRILEVVFARAGESWTLSSTRATRSC